MTPDMVFDHFRDIDVDACTLGATARMLDSAKAKEINRFLNWTPLFITTVYSSGKYSRHYNIFAGSIHILKNHSLLYAIMICTVAKIRVLIEAGPMVDTHKTGVGYYVEGLARALTEKPSEFEYTGFFFNFLRLNKERIFAGANLRLHRIWLVPGKLLSVCRRLGFQPFLEFFTWRRADIVLYTNYVALPLLRRKTKTALVIYDLSFLDHPEFTQDVNLQFLKRFCPPSIMQADLIITISEFTKQRLMEHFSGLKAQIVVTPIPPTYAPQQLSLQDTLVHKGIQPDKYVLYVGTIEPRKNLQALLKAWSLMDVALRDKYSLVLAGGKGWKDEAIRADIQSMQKKGFNVITPGYISEEEKQALYSNAASFVLPSHYEGFGMPILEAMQHRVPVVVSDLPVFHEVAGDAAVYFDKDKPEDIVEKLSGLLTDQGLRESLQEKGQAQLKKFNWDDNAQRVVTALTKIIDA